MTIIYEIEANDWPVDADDLPFGATIQGNIGSSYDYDYYRLAVQSAGYVQLQLDVPTTDLETNYFYFSLSDDTLGSDSLLFDGLGADETYTTYLNAAGTYYVAMSAATSEYHSGNYQLTTSFSATPIADPDSGIAPDTYEVNGMSHPYDLGTASTGNLVTNATIHSAEDWDYYRIYIDGSQDLDFVIDHDISEGGLAFSLKTEDFVNLDDYAFGDFGDFEVSASGLEAGYYLLSVLNLEGETSSGYSISAVPTGYVDTALADTYEDNNNQQAAADLGNVEAGTEFNALTLHHGSDVDYYRFTLSNNQNLSIVVGFEDQLSDIDIDLYDSDGYYLNGSYSVDDNEILDLSGYQAGDYIVKVASWNEQSIDSYGIAFIENDTNDWQTDYQDYQTYLDDSSVVVDVYDDGTNNDSQSSAVDLGAITAASTGISGLTIHDWGDRDFYQFTYDANNTFVINLSSSDVGADLDIALYDTNGWWLDSSLSLDSSEQISMAGLSSGAYYLEVYGAGTLADDYAVNFDAVVSNAIDDAFEPNNSFETAIDLGAATGTGEIAGLTLAPADEDWFKATFNHAGTVDQFVTLHFDHQDGDVDFGLYDSQGNFLRNATSITDNETIYLSDLSNDTYYFRIYGVALDGIQEYDIEYSFPVDSQATANVVADDLEGATGNNSYLDASAIELWSSQLGLTLHNLDDEDWFRIETRNTSTDYSSFTVYGSADDAPNLTLFAYDTDGSTLLEVDSASGDTLAFGGYAAGVYYLRVDADVITPNYQLYSYVTEQQQGVESTSLPVDQFDQIANNDTQNTATQLGLISRTMELEDLSIHSESDRDFYQFQVAVAGQANIALDFIHDHGDVDAYLFDANGTEIAAANSTSDNETISFTAKSNSDYYLKVYGYGGSTNTDYGITLTPTILNDRRDDYEFNDTAATAVTVPDDQVFLQDLTLHDASDIDWFAFTLTETGSAINTLNISNLLGSDVNLSTFAADGQTLVASTAISAGQGRISLENYAAGDYYAQVSMADTSSSLASNYDLLVNQAAANDSDMANWTIMVYIAADNNLAYAGVDDLNEMESVVLPDSVNVVTLTDLSGDSQYSTSAGWTDTRVGAISTDANGYSYAGQSLVSQLDSWGERNTGDGATLTEFINYSTTNYSADNYALVVWDHGGGLNGVAWDDSSNHDKLTISELRNAIDSTNAFSGDNKLDLIGFDACLMQTYEVGLEMAAIANTMVASQETEPGDGWDYQAFLSDLSNNPYASAATLGDYIVDSYDDFYGSNETLSAIDLNKLSAIATAVDSFNTLVQGAAATDWLVIDAAKVHAWSSSSLDYWRNGDDIDMGQFFAYIADNLANSTIAAAAGQIVDDIADSVLSNASHLGLSGLSATFWDVAIEDTAFASSLVDSLADAWAGFWDIFNAADRSASNTGSYALSADYLESRDAFGAVTLANETYHGAFELGTVTNNSGIANLSLHQADDVDWYEFSTPETLNAGDNHILVSAVGGTTNIATTLYDENFAVISTANNTTSALTLAAATDYYIKVEFDSYSQDSYYDLNFNLQTTAGLVVSDIAEGQANNNTIDKATVLAFEEGGTDLISSLNLSLTNGDEDWYLVNAQRISEQSPNVFSIELADAHLSNDADLVVAITDASGNVLSTSIGLGGAETVVFEEYANDVYFSVRSETGQQLEYSLNLAHADYDIDGDGQVLGSTDANALLAAMFADSQAQEIIDNLVLNVSSDSFEEYLDEFGNSLLDIDGDGVIRAATDGVILNAYIAGASAADLLPYVSDLSPIVTEEDLMTHLLELV